MTSFPPNLERDFPKPLLTLLNRGSWIHFSIAAMSFKPNRDLLNVNFEGYKLSGTPLSYTSGKVDNGVHVAKMKDEDFSFQHTRAYSLHNHLAVDPYNSQCVYWFGNDGAIQQGAFQVRSSSYKVVFDL